MRWDVAHRQRGGGVEGWRGGWRERERERLGGDKGQNNPAQV